MNRFLMPILFLFLLFNSPARASWILPDQTFGVDPSLADSIERWRDLHDWELRTILTGEQEAIFDRLVTGILAWAYTEGNRFDPEEFLQGFRERDDSVYVLRYPNDGLGLVIRGAFIRVELDTARPEFLRDEDRPLWPREGRWFAEIGCGSHSQIFYFVAATPDESGLTASQQGTCLSGPVP